jgi:hypothetical protein
MRTIMSPEIPGGLPLCRIWAHEIEKRAEEALAGSYELNEKRCTRFIDELAI